MTLDTLIAPAPSASMSEAAAVRHVQVLLPLPFDTAFDYLLPPTLLQKSQIAPGMLMRVPFGRRVVLGMVQGTAPPEAPPEKMREAIALEELPAFAPGFMRFLDWAASYTLTSRGALLKLALPLPAQATTEDMKQQRRNIEYSWNSEFLGKLTARRVKIQQLLLKSNVAMTRGAIAEQADASEAMVAELIRAGALIESLSEEKENTETFTPTTTSLAPLSSEQSAAAAALVAPVAAQKYQVTVLDGVTGSGKTEVYFAAIEAALSQKKQVLVLLPEISLSHQWLDRFRTRFGEEPAIWHSDISPARKRRTWRSVAEGNAKLVVGARSALFLPFRNLGLIVVDEEHEAAYKQEEGVIYHARDMAVARAHHEQLPVILVSATPSLETLANIQAGKYVHVRLPQRHGGALFPKVHVADLRKAKLPSSRFLSPALLEALEARLARGEQSLLFLNRRGYAPLLLCRACGYRFTCPSCSSWLVYHQPPKSQMDKPGRLQCHHCGYAQRFALHQPAAEPPTPNPHSTNCPSCAEPDKFAACGPGVERVAEEVATALPSARLLTLTSDTAVTPAKMQEALEAIASGKIDIVLGTQMLAKGHHFPKLTLVGVVDADLGMDGADLRASERTFQLLHQVSGRAGREELPGEVWLQTYQPDHPVLQALIKNDRDGFYELELDARQHALMPPFARLGAIIISGTKEEEVRRAADALARSSSCLEGCTLFGPAPAPLSRLRGNFRWRLLVRGSKESRLQPLMRRWIQGAAIPASVRLKVDIDPYNFL